MLSRLRSHVRHNVVGYIALFIALSGTAYAAKPLITGADVQDESLTGADIANGSLGTAEFSSSIPAARVNGDLDLTTDCEKILDFTHEDYDTANLHSTSSNPSRLTAPAAGIYRLSGTASFGFNSDPRIVDIKKNGNFTNFGDEFGAPGDHSFVEVSSDFKLAAGDYLEVRVVTPGTCNTEAGVNGVFTMSWVAPG